MDDWLVIGVLLMLVWKSPLVDWGGGWTWPVPDSPNAPAVVSQEFKPGTHKGVDIMQRAGGQFVVRPGTPVLAARSGRVYSTAESARGHNVVLDHGPPWATFYQHLDTVSVIKGQAVEAGDQIGTVGIDPTDPEQVRHLHFEAWYKGGPEAAVDPRPAMAAWSRKSWT